MADNCNCENIDRCSIIGYLQAGFICQYFKPMDADSTFETADISSFIRKTEMVVPMETTIKDGVLRVVINKEGKKIPLEIDIKQELDS